MSDMILWRKIPPTDILSMGGKAAPAGTGGGAKHIALGVDSFSFPIYQFLGVSGCGNKTIMIEPIPGLVEAKQIEFSSKDSRRGGEWRISRQHHDRYPLWTGDYGFPEGITSYDPSDPPVIFIIRISNEYHARFCMLSDLANIFPALHNIIISSTKNSGIGIYQQQMGGLLGHLIPPPGIDKRIAQPAATSSTTIPTPPLTTSSVVTRYIRDTAIGNELKSFYEYKCSFCNTIISRPFDNPYVEACHIKPLNEDGPDIKENIIVLCPNHHVELDFGAITIDPISMTISHIDKTNPLDGKKVQLKHQIDDEYLEFHYQCWKNKKLMGY